ncbi:hypothetical protein KFK09_004232 [Dendrobium nobile]|uniref:Uncharacterized protein n=1 Tax=Dendrobium nobile TaxID=94219 RepID=A0A8T3C278_DENNO|nr:hypothetical protein KFK09_004232 [Dendrobium nobile]
MHSPSSVIEICTSDIVDDDPSFRFFGNIYSGRHQARFEGILGRAKKAVEPENALNRQLTQWPEIQRSLEALVCSPHLLPVAPLSVLYIFIHIYFIPFEPVL